MINKVLHFAFVVKYSLLMTKCYVEAAIKRKCSKKRFAFFVMTPKHSNLGDQAITYTAMKFLDQYVFVEITGEDLSRFVRVSPKFLKKLFKNDVIFVQGGGSLGTLYMDTETTHRNLMKICSNNKIIILPQTIYYDDNEHAREFLEESKAIYNNCCDLHIFLREKISYDFSLNLYENVYLTPDIVLTYNKYTNKNIKRNGAKICIRTDDEKTLTNEYIDSLFSFIKSKFDHVSSISMVADYRITKRTREKHLFNHFDKFASSELIITDRLHGMIFSAITGTPCIVLNSKSHKVKGIYDWIFSDCEYITFTDNFGEMEKFIEHIKGKSFTYDNSSIMHYYSELKEFINREI